MARIPEANYKLITESEMYKMIMKHPELSSHTFEGFCTLTETDLSYGPQGTANEHCENCFPTNHIVIMPLKFFEEKVIMESSSIYRSISTICSLYRQGTSV